MDVKKQSDELPVPSDIVENSQALLETDLSDNEKLKALEKAEVHAQQMMDAAGEGMTGDDLPVLDDVGDSIKKLKSKQATWLLSWNDVKAKAAQLGERWGWRAHD